MEKKETNKKSPKKIVYTSYKIEEKGSHACQVNQYIIVILNLVYIYTFDPLVKNLIPSLIIIIKNLIWIK